MKDMAGVQEEAVEVPRKSGFLPVFIGIFAMVLGSWGGFLAVQRGFFQSGESPLSAGQAADAEPLPDVTYVPIEPMVVTLRGGQSSNHLRFSAELEVYAPYSRDVAHFLPRIQDVLNTYLRSVRVSDLEDSIALYRIRSHLLHRVNLVVGEGRVRDVLITEFVMT